jgi:hypothetical protein
VGSELDRILESPQNTALHVINGTVQASQSTVALRAAKQGGCGGSEVQKKTRQTLLTEALTQLCGEGRRMLKLRKKINAISSRNARAKYTQIKWQNPIPMRLRETTADDAVKQPMKLAVKQSSCETTAVRHPGLAVETSEMRALAKERFKGNHNQIPQ